MQAIETKFLPATNTRPNRYKAECARGSITIDQDDNLSIESNHIRAAELLLKKFVAEDLSKYGEKSKSAWDQTFNSGTLKNGNYVHILTY